MPICAINTLRNIFIIQKDFSIIKLYWEENPKEYPAVASNISWKPINYSALPIRLRNSEIPGAFAMETLGAPPVWRGTLTHYQGTPVTLRRDTQRGSDQQHSGAQLRKPRPDHISTSCEFFSLKAMAKGQRCNRPQPEAQVEDRGKEENGVPVKTETTRMLNSNHCDKRQQPQSQ